MINWGFTPKVEGVECDCLYIILATYFSGHMQRPDDDDENEDNHYWGDWVIEKTEEAKNDIQNRIQSS